MANFYSDNPDLEAQLEYVDLKEVVTLMENGFAGGDDADHVFPAPESFEDAMEFFAGSLDLLGDISANVIAPHRQEVDVEGTRHEDGVVTYAKGTQVAVEALSEAGFMGAMLPRAYGGASSPDRHPSGA